MVTKVPQESVQFGQIIDYLLLTAPPSEDDMMREFAVSDLYPDAAALAVHQQGSGHGGDHRGRLCRARGSDDCRAGGAAGDPKAECRAPLPVHATCARSLF